jgi:hypothetical protein
MSEFRIAIVGGGPRATYALERLAAMFRIAPPARALRVAVFERSGLFGAGETHSPDQPATSYLNRVVGQVAFAADESNEAARDLLPPALRRTFAQWCSARHRATGDERFDLLADDVPRRYIHGLALRDAFERYVAILRRSGVAVELHSAEVTDVSSDEGEGGPVSIHSKGAAAAPLRVDRALFVTGHSYNRPKPGSLGSTLAEFARQTPGVRYVEHAYPLEQAVSEAVAPPGCRVGLRGLGLTAIDVVLALTEGRGGRFATADAGGALPRLRYMPSGREPALIVGTSRSGLVHSCRARNAKAEASDVHRPVFFTQAALEALRAARGEPRQMSDGRCVRQLDFERDIFPAIILEMAYAYYRTLLGVPFGEYVRASAGSAFQAFVSGPRTGYEASIGALLSPVQACFSQAAAHIRARLEGQRVAGDPSRFDEMRVLQAFATTVWGAELGRLNAAGQPLVASASDAALPPSPWEHPTSIDEHRFEWRSFFQPLTIGRDHRPWSERLTTFLRRDLAYAAQNNVANPVKAACDGVWRDLRAELADAVDRGALLPDSQRQFEAKYLRHYNRMANGAAIEPMQKILALIEAGVLDVSLGPEPRITGDAEAGAFRITARASGEARNVSVLVDARIHSFDAEMDVRPLYPSLVRRGLVRKWTNPGTSRALGHAPGALDLSAQFHPYRRDGSVDERLTFLGAPADRLVFFQLAAARPASNSYVLNAIARWTEEVVGATRARSGRAGAGDAPVASGDVPSASRAPSIETFRSSVRAILDDEARSGRRRHVVILGVDGIPYDLARHTWRHASLTEHESVFPTTSSTAWLTSLSGMSVAEHGIPGVVFKLPDAAGAFVNVFEHQGGLLAANQPADNIFSDARELGYEPLCIQGDMEDYDCAWRRVLLKHARQIGGHKFYTSLPSGEAPPDVSRLRDRIDLAVRGTLETHGSAGPCLIWCFIEADRHVHHFGYDEHVTRALEAIEALALRWAEAGAIVLAHSDHGLIATRHDVDVEKALGALQARYPFEMGGAGRARWVYVEPTSVRALQRELLATFSGAVQVLCSDALFTAGSVARRRVGQLSLLARDDRFLAPRGYRYDHGSLTAAELHVPVARWAGD